MYLSKSKCSSEQHKKLLSKSVKISNTNICYSKIRQFLIVVLNNFLVDLKNTTHFSIASF